MAKQDYLDALALITEIEDEHPELVGSIGMASQIDDNDPRLKLIRQKLWCENIYQVRLTNRYDGSIRYFRTFTDFKRHYHLGQLTIGKVEDNNGNWRQYRIEFGEWRSDKVGYWQDGKSMVKLDVKK